MGRRVFYPSLLGKLSTASQLVTVGVVLLLNAFLLTLPWLDALFVVTLTLTVGSAFHYLYSSSTRKARS
jgi:phosphatidylglycerophosphate synthase